MDGTVVKVDIVCQEHPAHNLERCTMMHFAYETVTRRASHQIRKFDDSITFFACQTTKGVDGSTIHGVKKNAGLRVNALYAEVMTAGALNCTVGGY